MEFKAHYKDENYDCDIIIKNSKTKDNYYEMSFTLDGITFVSFDLYSFELKNPEDYETAKEKFKILKWGGKQHLGNRNYEVRYSYELQRYEMAIEIPVAVVQRCTGNTRTGIIRVRYILSEHNAKKHQAIRYCDDEKIFIDDTECTEFTFIVDGKCFSVDEPTTYFEDALLQIHKKCKEDYLIKCCFTCQYSDYSPYGNDNFGTMLCYKKHKDIYLTVNDKKGYFKKLDGLDCEKQQETNVCDSYEERLKCEGYRGKI